MIEVSNLWRGFAEKEVLRGINLTIAKAEATVIIGASGAGKSVFLKHIIGLLKPDKGDILIEGISIAKSRGRELDRLRNRFGMVFQSGALLNSLSAGENIALPLVEHTNMKSDQIRHIVREKLKLVNLSGIETERPENLSGGMRKRVAVARAIIRNPEIILYDEPTAGLDPPMARSIEKLIIDLKERLGVLSLIVTHDIQSACRIGDKIAVLDKGKILWVGPPEEISRSDEPFIKHFLLAD